MEKLYHFERIIIRSPFTSEINEKSQIDLFEHESIKFGKLWNRMISGETIVIGDSPLNDTVHSLKCIGHSIVNIH